MVKLTSSLYRGKNCRTVDEFDRPINGVGYQNFHRPAMSLQIEGPDLDREPNPSKARDYRLSLTEDDLGQIINRIFNQLTIVTLGQLSSGDYENDTAMRFYGRVAKNAGLPLSKFKVTVDNRDYFMLAISLSHAEGQIRKHFPNWVGKATVISHGEFDCG